MGQYDFTTGVTVITTFDDITLLSDFEGGVIDGMSNLNDYADTDFNGGEL